MAQRSKRPGLRATSRILVAILVAGLPLALGGAHAITNALAASLAVVALALGSFGRSRRHTWHVSPIVYVVGLAWIATALQLVPLPLALFEWVSPGTYSALTLFPEPSSWAVVSLDPPATAHELVKLCALVAVALVASELGGGRHQKRLVAVVTATAGVVMLLGVAFSAAGIKTSYGLAGRPVMPFPSSFINSNHLAGFLGFCALLAAAASLRNPRIRPLSVPVAAACCVGVVMTQSLSGIVAMLAVGALAVVAAVAVQPRAPKVVSFWAASVSVVGVAVALAIYTGPLRQLRILANPVAYQKLQLWRAVPGMLLDFPFLGAGRGSFAGAGARFVEMPFNVVFTHIENEALQALADWGPFAGTAIVILAAWAVWSAYRGAAADQRALVMVTPFLFLALQNNVDFNLTLTGVSVPVVAVLASLCRSPFAHNSARMIGVRRVRWVALVLGAVAIGASVFALEYSTARDTERLEEILSRPQGRDATAELEAICRRHPANFYFPYRVAREALTTTGWDQAALPWINRAMWLSPHTAAPHWLAGVVLTRLGYDEQGMLEFRLAARASPADTSTIAEVVTSLHGGDARWAAKLSSDSPTSRRRVAKFLLERRMFAEAEEVLAAHGGPNTAFGYELWSRVARARGDNELALERARHAQSLNPRHAAPYELQAAVLADRSGDEALAVLSRGAENAKDAWALHRQRTQLLLKLERYDRASAAARQTLELARTPHQRASGYWLLGQASEAQGQHHAALREYQRATGLAPKDVPMALARARAHVSVGEKAKALEYLRAFRQVVDKAPAVDAHIARLEASEATP